MRGNFCGKRENLSHKKGRAANTVRGGTLMTDPHTAREIAWRMFAKTGNPAYYELYRRLEEDTKRR